MVTGEGREQREEAEIRYEGQGGAKWSLRTLGHVLAQSLAERRLQTFECDVRQKRNREWRFGVLGAGIAKLLGDRKRIIQRV